MQATLRKPVGISLREFFSSAQAFGDCDVWATSCSSDSSRIEPGDVYFSLGDCSTEQAKQAVERGAVAVVADQLLPIFGTAQFVVPDASAAYAEFCQRLVGSPSEDIVLAGVLGAHGKSSVARLLAGILRGTDGSVACLADELESDGAVTKRSDENSVTAPRFARWLGRSSATGTKHAVVEVKPQGVLDGCYAGAKFGLLCLTNLNYDRSSGRTPAADRDLTERMIDRLAPFATLVANADDPHCMKQLAERHGLTITYGMENPADISGVVLSRDTGGQVLMVTHGTETVAVGLSHIGDALAQNCLAAIASAVALGVEFAEACRNVESCLRLPGVMQGLPAGQPFPVYLDQCDTPERLRATLNAARSVAQNRVIAVLPENAPNSLYSVATALSDLVIAPRELQEDVPDQSVRCVEDRFSATALALALAEQDDVVLMAGVPKGFSERTAEITIAKQLIELRLSNTHEPIVVE